MISKTTSIVLGIGVVLILLLLRATRDLSFRLTDGDHLSSSNHFKWEQEKQELGIEDTHRYLQIISCRYNSRVLVDVTSFRIHAPRHYLQCGGMP